MTPLRTPTSPSFESHPATPLSPSFNHPLDSSFSSPISSPRLKVNTTFSFHPLSLKNSPILGQIPQTAAHKRGPSSVSTLSFPSPAADGIFQHVPPTPRTPGPNVAFYTLFSPGGPAREDGRQSRMAMRSPIVERVLSLPLRVHTNSARTPPSEPRFPNPPNSMASTESSLSDDAMSISSPTSAYTARPLTPVIEVSAPPPPRRTSAAAHTRTLQPKNKRAHSPPPHYHLNVQPTRASTLAGTTTTNSTLPTRTPAQRQAYSTAVSHLRTPLVPLISVTTGLPHPAFPRSLLQYHLLTHAQLDSLSRWYHQTQPATKETWMYPAWVPPFVAQYQGSDGSGVNYAGQDCSRGFEAVTLEVKRRRWGRFIGLRGCESPTETEGEGGEGIMERMQREWDRERERMRDEEIAREKGWRGRW